MREDVVFLRSNKDEKNRWSCRLGCLLAKVEVVQACEDPGDVGAGLGLGMLRLKNAATPLTKAVVSSGGDGTAMGIEQC